MSVFQFTAHDAADVADTRWGGGLLAGSTLLVLSVLGTYRYKCSLSWIGIFRIKSKVGIFRDKS